MLNQILKSTPWSQQFCLGSKLKIPSQIYIRIANKLIVEGLMNFWLQNCYPITILVTLQSKYKICVFGQIYSLTMKHLFKRVVAGLVAPILTTWKPKNRSDDENPAQQIQTTIDKIFLTSLQSEFETLKLFSLSAQKLARQIASHLDIGLGRLHSSKFNDGEINLQILDSVRGHKVYLVKSFQNQNINDGIMELLLAVSTLKKEGAQSVTAIVPYLPYSLPTNIGTNEINEGIDFYTCFGADLVKMLEALGCDQVITMNNPMSSPKGFAQSSKFMNVQATQLVVPYLIYSNIKDPVVVGVRSNRLHVRGASQLSNTFSLFDFHCGIGFYNNGIYFGEDFKDRDVVMFSNVIRTGNTLRQLAIDVKRKGARNIYCYGFHGLSSDDQLEKLITELPIKQLILTNSIQHAVENKRIRTISLAKFLAEIITIVNEEKSLSTFRGSRQILHYGYLTKIKEYNRLGASEARKEQSVPTEESPETN